MRIVFWLDPKVGFDWSTPEVISSLADGLAEMGYEVELIVENQLLDDYRVEHAGRRVWFEESNQQILADVLITNRLENLLRRDLYQAGERIWLALEDDLTAAFRHFEIYQLHEEIRVFTLTKQLKDRLVQSGINAHYIRPGIRLERCKAAASKEREYRGITLGVFDPRPETVRMVFKGVEMTRVALNRMQIQVFTENEVDFKSSLPVQIKLKPSVDERIRCYQNSDLLIYIPGQEKTSLFPVEAMAVGVPVILPPQQGLQEFARPKQNCLVLARLHPQELALAILNVAKIGNLREQLKVQGMKTGQEYDLKQSLRNLEQLWSGHTAGKNFFVQTDVHAGNPEEMVDVVVLNTSGGDAVKDCISSLRANTGYPHRITVVDNGSNEETLNYLKQERGLNLIVNQQNTGFAGAYNQGILAGKGNYIMLAHSDVRFTPGWLAPLLAELKDQDVGMAIPRLLTEGQLVEESKTEEIQVEADAFEARLAEGVSVEEVSAEKFIVEGTPAVESATEESSTEEPLEFEDLDAYDSAEVVDVEWTEVSEAEEVVNEELHLEDEREAVNEVEAEAPGEVESDFNVDDVGAAADNNNVDVDANADANADTNADANADTNAETEENVELEATIEPTPSPTPTPDFVTSNDGILVGLTQSKQGAEVSNHISGEKEKVTVRRTTVELDPFSPTIPGGPFMIRRELLNRLGLLDEGFAQYGEGLDYSLRVQEKGYKVSKCASSTVMYVPAHDSKSASNSMSELAAIGQLDVMQGEKRLKAKWGKLTPGSKRDADGIVILGLLPWQKKAQRTQAAVDLFTTQGLKVVYVEPYCSNRTPQSPANDPYIFACKGSGSIFNNLANQGRSVEMAADLRGKLAAWGIHMPILMVEAPWWEPFLKHIEHRLLVYVTPEILLGEEIETVQHLKENFAAPERALLKAADFVIAGSRKRRDELENERVKVLYVPGGFFPADLERFLKGYYTMPEELTHLGNCKIGITGTFDRYFPKYLLKEIAVKHPEVALIFIGEITCDLGELAHIPNLHFLGNKGWDYLLDCIYFFDLVLYPYAARGLNVYFDPLILNYYLAMGKPVVAFDHPELLKYGRIVERAANDQEFLELVGQTIRRLEKEKSEERIRERLQTVRGHSWEEQTREIFEELIPVFPLPEPEKVEVQAEVECVPEVTLAAEESSEVVALGEALAEVQPESPEVQQYAVGQQHESAQEMQVTAAEAPAETAGVSSSETQTKQDVQEASVEEMFALQQATPVEADVTVGDSDAINLEAQPEPEPEQVRELQYMAGMLAEVKPGPFAALWRYFVESYQRLRGGRKDAQQ